MTDIHIQHNEQEKIFFVKIEDKIARLNYKFADEKTLDYYSTYVPPEFRGKNIGDKLVKFALDYAREHHYAVIPSCSFVAKIIERTKEYKDIVKK